MKDYSVYSFKLNHDITLTEITVPTCSYRMGVPRMGFGYALIGDFLLYTNLKNVPWNSCFKICD